MRHEPQAQPMKKFLLLLCCLNVGEASAQPAPLPALDANAVNMGQNVLLPVFLFGLLAYIILTAIKLLLNYLLKRQIVAAAPSESIVERLLPGPQNEQNKVVKWVALLLSTGTGLALCNWYQPWGLHSVIILLFSTALGFLAYYLFVRRQAK